MEQKNFLLLFKPFPVFTNQSEFKFFSNNLPRPQRNIRHRSFFQKITLLNKMQTNAENGTEPGEQSK